jgi:hypothetical protein
MGSKETEDIEKGKIKIIENCHYDKQMCIYGGINNEDIKEQAEGYLTKDIIGTGLINKLGDAEWIYTDNLYPTLKGLENESIAMIARSPAYLDDKYKTNFDQHNNIRKCFPVNVENNVEWIKAFSQVNIMPSNNVIYNNVYLNNIGNDTLYAGIEIAKKTIPITILNNSIPCGYNLILKDNPSGSAEKLVGAGNYEEGEIAIYQAIPNECYTFINWTDSITGEEISFTELDSIVMDKDYTLIANFTRDSFDLMLKTNPENAGIIIGAGRYDCNTTAIYQAISNECYTFINWTDSITGEEISFTELDSIVMDKDYTLIANFARDSFDLILKTNPENAGIIIGARRYGCGDTIEIEAIAKEFYNFYNWSDTSDNIITKRQKHIVILKNDSILVANFYEINLIVRWDTVYTKPGDTISLTATLESIDIPLIFSSIDFHIDMDYKLLYPTKLFVVDSNDIEYPISFDFSFSRGIRGEINYQPLKSGQRLLRLEGLTLVSKPTETPVIFGKFDILTEQKYRLSLLEGLLDVSDFCGANGGWRVLLFMPEFDVELENIINEELLIDFNTTGILDVDVELIDIDGATIHQTKFNLPKGNTTKQIKLNNLAVGKYFIRFSNPFNSIITRQFIKR